MSTAQKTGVFFIFGLLLLGIFTFKMEDLGKIFHHRYTIVTSFKHAAGLEPGDPVAIAGVKVGVIRGLTIAEGRVRVTMEVQSDLVVYPGAKAVVDWSGVLGRKYVDLTLGDTSQAPLADGAYVEGVESLSVGDVMERVEHAVGAIDDVMRGDTVQSFRDLGPKLNRVLDSMAKVSDKLEEGKSTIGRLMTSDELYVKLDEIADQLREGGKTLNSMLGATNERIEPILADIEAAAPELKGTFAAVQRFTEEFNESEGTLPKLIKDKEIYESLRETVSNLREMTEQINQGDSGLGRLLKDPQFAEDLRIAASDIKNVAERLNRGQGTMPRLLRDDDLYKDVKKLVADAQEAVRSVQEQIPIGTFTGVLLSAF